MQWGNTQYLLLFILLPILIGLSIFLFKKQKERIAEFCDLSFVKNLLPFWNPNRLILRKVFFILFFVFLALALSEPKWGYHLEEVIRKGSDLFLVVDVSNSMLAEDLKPNRLERAKRKIYDLLKMANGDRIGMILFAGKSILICPLTLDYQTIQQFLDSLSPDLIPIQGSDLAGALKLGMESFKDPKSSKGMILLTDGEYHSSQIEPILKDLEKKKIPLYILGFGTPEGAPIPLPKGEGGFKRDESGNVILSKLEEKGLSELASETGGAYVRSVTNDDDLNEIYAKDLKGALKGNEIKSGKKRVYESRFQWPLLIAFLFLIVEFLVGEGKKQHSAVSSQRSVNGSKFAFYFIFILLTPFSSLLSSNSYAGPLSFLDKYQGTEAYEEKRFTEARERFERSAKQNPADGKVLYDLGNSYYRTGEFAKAIETFSKSAQTQDLKLKQKSFYNLGNSLYRTDELEKSLQAYTEALKIDPKDEESKLNFEFVKKKLEEKKKKEEEKKQQQQQQQNQNQQGQGGQDQQNQESQNQSQKPDDSQKNQDQQQNQQQDQKDQSSNQQDQNQEKGDNQNQNDQNNPSKQPPSDGKLEGRNPEQDQNQKNNDQQNPPQEGKGGMSPQEAEQWLGSLEEDQGKILKGEISKKLGRSRKVDKDW